MRLTLDKVVHFYYYKMWDGIDLDLWSLLYLGGHVDGPCVLLTCILCLCFSLYGYPFLKKDAGSMKMGAHKSSFCSRFEQVFASLYFNPRTGCAPWILSF